MKQFYFAYEPQVHKSKVVAFIHCLPGKRSEVHFQNLDLSLLPPCCPHIWNALLWYIHLHTSPSALFPHLEYSTGTHTPAHLSISLVPTAGILYQGICTCTPLHPPCSHSWNTLSGHMHLHSSSSTWLSIKTTLQKVDKLFFGYLKTSLSLSVFYICVKQRYPELFSREAAGPRCCCEFTFRWGDSEDV